MRDLVIEVKDLTRTYHVGDVDVHALRGVSFHVERGELVAVMGPSGSGKSTLMSILGCLDRPTRGEYFFEGVDVAGLREPEAARIRSEGIGFVFQSFNLLGRTSAIENVALPLFYSQSGPSRREPRLEQAHAALTLVGLGEREKNTPAQLSGGEQQRAAIARALINSPSLLLADEPTGNLDTSTSHQIMETLVTLNRERGVTVIIVTHESDIAAYADRIITMRDGQILSDERTPRPHRGVETSRLPSGEAVWPIGGIAQTGKAARPAGAGSGAFGLMLTAAAVQAIGRNKLRSALTILGVFIGVAALIAMEAVGQGAKEEVKKRIESLGTNMVVVLPGAATEHGLRGGAGSATTLTVTDAQAIRHEDPAVSRVAYLIRQRGQVQYRDRNWSTEIYGASPEYPAITNWTIAAGRGFTGEDDAGAALVALIGQSVYRQLFGPYENPLGATIFVKTVPVRVVGLLAAKGQTPFGMDQDDLVMIPFTTAQGKVLGVAAPTQVQAGANPIYEAPPNPFGLRPRLTGYVNSIYVEAVAPDRVQAAIQQVSHTLGERHHIPPGGTNDFSVRNLSQIAETAQSSSQTMALLLATVASISLVVGGIGIMNILLVSVTERTREIGLRMAIGARRVHVLLQFLAEAVLLSVAGGVVGIVFGVTVSGVISRIAGWPTLVPPAAIAGGFFFSAAVGIFFGYYPARKASRLDPMDALRYE
jgi:macrolide transport system ATP-binding/permease protein